jgi:hypothetical protein
MGGVFLSNTIFLTFPCLLLSVIIKFSLSNYLLLSSVVILKGTRPAWAGFKTAEEGIAIIMSYIL